MKEVLTVLILAVIVEKCLGLFRDFSPRKLTPRLKRFASLFLAIALTLVTRVGLLAAFRLLPADANAGHQVIDFLLTGMIIARGSNVVHDLFAVIERGKALLGDRTGR